MSLLCQLCARTQQGLSIRLRSPDGLGVFYKEVLDFLGHMDVIERLISPIAGTLSVIIFRGVSLVSRLYVHDSE